MGNASSIIKVRINSLVLFAGALILLAGMFGCVKLERPTLDRKYFTLDVDRTGMSVHKIDSGKNLIVRRVKISPRYEDRDLVYRVGENSFEADYYNTFFIPPASLVTQELRLWMGETKLFAHVLGPESMSTGELILEGMVNSLYGDYTGPTPQAVVEMQFFLLDNSNPDIPIIYSRNFSKKNPVDALNPDALVRAMNKGFKDIFSELEEDVAKVIANGPAKK